jgi:hypothetical protein
MKRVLLTLTAIVALAVPAAAMAHPTKNEKRHAAKECKAERQELGRQAFAEKYGTNRNKRNAFGKCVSKKAHQAEVERKAARKKAAKECRAEREQLGAEGFAQKYGTNANRRNAFGKCVSRNAKQSKAEGHGESRREANSNGETPGGCNKDKQRE